jgi:hypothetical protein
MSSMAQMLNAMCVFIMLERQIILFIYWGNSISSDMLYSQVIKKKKIPLPNLNYDDTIMSRENSKFSLTSFCKRQGVTIV